MKINFFLFVILLAGPLSSIVMAQTRADSFRDAGASSMANTERDGGSASMVNSSEVNENDYYADGSRENVYKNGGAPDDNNEDDHQENADNTTDNTAY